MLRYTGHALLLVLAAIFVFHSPFTRWWTELNLPWYTIFLLWFVLIALVALDNLNSDAGNDQSNSQGSDQGSNNSNSAEDDKHGN